MTNKPQRTSAGRLAWQAQKEEGEEEGEKHEGGEREESPSPLSPTPLSFPFFPIIYPFRRLLRRLALCHRFFFSFFGPDRAQRSVAFRY